MKCPKCQYISFEAAPRCRNCGFEFSLAVATPDAAELPLGSGPDGPPADYALHPDAGGVGSRVPRASRAASRQPTPGGFGDLPLFEAPVPGVDDTPLIKQAGTPRLPLAVRRSSEPPRRPGRGPGEPTPASHAPHAERPRAPSPAAPVAAVRRPDGVALGARAAAAAIDVAILGAIDVVVLYATLRVTGLPLAEAARLPLVPFLAFLAVLDGGYLVGFVTAAGQTIGQMAMGQRVVTDEGGRVPLAQAVVRAAAVAVSVLPLGLGCLPLLTDSGNPALHDRVSRTRVVRD